MMKKRHEYHIAPKIAIAVLLGAVALYDYCCKPGNTISEEIDRLRKSETTGEATNWVIDTLYNHLKRSVEPRDDPIHRLAVLFNKD